MKNDLSKFKSLLLILLLISCTQEPDASESSNSPGNGSSCNLQEIESNLNSKLSTYVTSTDFSFYIEREDGRTYSYNNGSSTLNTPYLSASSSKWVSAAAILWVLDNTSGCDLTDIPSDHYSWSMNSGDLLYNASLSQLLSFTSGMQQDAFCLSIGIPSKTFDNCINDATGSLVSLNEGQGYTPGTNYHYGSPHLQVAGAMAISAGGYSDWHALFNAFKSDIGAFSSSSSVYNRPSLANPRLAGGMTWTANDYIPFLRAIYNKSFLSESLFDEMLKDHIGSKTIAYSPVLDDYNEEWHYGFGVWLECHNSSFNCNTIDYYSSPGSYGAYPFVSYTKKYFGILARQGALGTFTEGLDLFRHIQSEAENWAGCK